MLDRIKIIYLIAKNVFKASLRDRVMYGLVFLSLLFISMAHLPFVLKEIPGFKGEIPLNMAIQIGFFFITIFMFLIVVFVSLGILQDQLESGKMLLILSKPIRRGEVLLGINLGLVEILFLNWLVITGGLWLTAFIHTGQLNLNIFLGMGVIFLMAVLFLSLIITIYTFIPSGLSGLLAFLVFLGSFGAANSIHLTRWMDYPLLLNSTKIIIKCFPRVVPLLAVSMKTLGMISIEVNFVAPIVHTLISIIIFNLVAFFKFNQIK
ncbi:hypothetical protein KAI68_03640 [bacterium]|nr:hypothetical protein [bacterium]